MTGLEARLGGRKSMQRTELQPELTSDWPEAASRNSPNLTRTVYCILGMPVDAIDLHNVIIKLRNAARNGETFLLSTPNLNFLVNSLSDPEFRQSLLDSDLCPPDGAPLIWIAKLTGLPIKERAAGSDIIDNLRSNNEGTAKLTVFLFGGATGVAAAAADALNRDSKSLRCVGTLDPGFGDVEALSADEIIKDVNSSHADFLVVALGAKKGQLWLQHNHQRLTIPIRAHLGAALNFQAGVVKRAPLIIRSWGLEWLWRIKEENYLWRRYLNDGLVLLRLLLTRVLPLAVLNELNRNRERRNPLNFSIQQKVGDRAVEISLSGFASERHVAEVIPHLEQVLTFNRDVVVNFSNTRTVDSRFLGLLMMLRKELKHKGATLLLTGLTPALERIFRLNELDYMLPTK
jgi:N-acetylglucosaminyldiphosphoundecaprenol N-acetyl-beta-D-mannosaminyltransferase